jgi:fructose-1,6-bisphosphatase/inositol monophosphatase family enzyme
VTPHDEFRETLRGCLRVIDEDYRALERDGHASTVTDRSVDFATAADTALTDTIRDYFASRPRTYRVLSEESTTGTDTADRATETDAAGGATEADAPGGGTATDAPDLTVVADEIDGTANMLNGGDAPFGPVVAIATAGDPTFDDVAAAGFLSLQTGDLYEAYRGEGAVRTERWARDGGDADRNDADGDDTDGNDADGDDADGKSLSTSGRTSVAGDDYPQLLVDQYMLSGVSDVVEHCLSTGYPGDFRSWMYHVALVARGSYDLAVTGDHCELNEAKRATAEELAAGYRLVTEAGGAVVTWEGNDLGPERIGMADGRTFDTVVGATGALAREFAGRLPER